MTRTLFFVCRKIHIYNRKKLIQKILLFYVKTCFIKAKRMTYIEK